jgi:hypothetical protein
LQDNKFTVPQLCGDRGSHASLIYVRYPSPEVELFPNTVDCDIDSPIEGISVTLATRGAHLCNASCNNGYQQQNDASQMIFALLARAFPILVLIAWWRGHLRRFSFAA